MTEDFDNEDDVARTAKRQRRVVSADECPYLDTVCRAVLDFDFEKICSVSLLSTNVYGCLVCGKYFQVSREHQFGRLQSMQKWPTQAHHVRSTFSPIIISQGRGPQSHAYTHALEVNHHVFINLMSGTVYCLPDDYEVRDSTLDDIRHQLEPRFSVDDVRHIDELTTYSRALDGTEYLPGLLGLNNIKENDSINGALQMLLRVRPLRDHFLRPENYADAKAVGNAAHLGRTLLVQRFGEFVRKCWNARSFKAHVSPHDVLQAISLASGKRFRIGQFTDPAEFLPWLLNELHKDLGGSRRANSSIVFQCFQGQAIVHTDKPLVVGAAAAAATASSAGADTADDPAAQFERTSAVTPFVLLTLEVPPPPLFKDELQGNVIPQVPIFQLLDKFNGTTVKKFLNGERRRYELLKLPPYLLVHLNRFTKNSFFTEKNPTIVNFPIRNLDLLDYIHAPLRARIVAERERAARNEPPLDAEARAFGATRYDLVANLRHEGSKPNQGTFRVHVQHKASERWFDVQDLVVDETIPQLIAVSEAYVLLFERQSGTTRSK
jgi:U4/U6.U5 tri-snRNP-associated protein 2